jgi:hypothetical protein
VGIEGVLFVVMLTAGEWSHLFYMMLLASGVNARYVWNRLVVAWGYGSHTQRGSRLERVLVVCGSTLGSR